MIKLPRTEEELTAFILAESHRDMIRSGERQIMRFQLWIMYMCQTMPHHVELHVYKQRVTTRLHQSPDVTVLQYHVKIATLNFGLVSRADGYPCTHRVFQALDELYHRQQHELDYSEAT